MVIFFVHIQSLLNMEVKICLSLQFWKQTENSWPQHGHGKTHLWVPGHQSITLHQLKLPSRAILKQLKIPKSTINDIIKIQEK